MDGIGITSIASREKTRAEEFARQYRIPSCHGAYDDLLADPDIDAVYIPLPPHLHLEYGVKAAEVGKHILMEKPAAQSAAEVRQLASACTANRVKFMEGFMYRFMSIHRRAKELATDDTIGRLRYIDFHFCFDLVTRGRTGYRTVRNEGGGALLDLGIYAVDFLRYVTDAEPVLLQAFTAFDKPDGVDEFTHAVFTSGDVVSTVTCSFTFDANYYVLSGDKGSVTSPVAISGRSLPNLLRIHLLEGDRKYEEQFPPENPYRSEMEYFGRCLMQGTEPFPGTANSLSNLGILDGIRAASIRLPRDLNSPHRPHS
jgi:predicted dehydrogenase